MSTRQADATDGAPDDREIVLGADVVARTRRTPGRVTAGAFDVVVGAYVVGSTLAALASLGVVRMQLPVGVGLLSLWVVLVLVEGLTGASPGKLVVGLEVVDEAGEPAGLWAAARRRPWGAPLLLVLVGLPTVRAVATIVAVAALLVTAVTTLRGIDGRAWQDRIAGTRVRESWGGTRPRTITILAVLALVLVSAVVRALAQGSGVA